MTQTLQFSRLPNNPDLPLPAYMTRGAAGLDVCSNENFTLFPGRWAVIGTGLRCIVPDFCELQVRPRSGLAARHGITILNSPGTIDADYRGEVKVTLINHSGAAFAIKRGDRIAQVVLCATVQTTITEISEAEMTTTERGTGGLGSTGVSLNLIGTSTL